MNTEQANRYLDGFQINDRSIYDSQDNEHPLDCILEDYHQEQLKLFSIHIFSQRSELLFALLEWIDYGDDENKEYIVESFLKDINSK